MIGGKISGDIVKGIALKSMSARTGYLSDGGVFTLPD